MKKWILLAILLFGSTVLTWAEDPAILELQAKLFPVKNITSKEASEMLKEDPGRTFLIDVRSMAEYELVGHPPEAFNIPYKLWTPDGLKSNPDFIDDVTEKFQKSDRLIMICRSGSRSRSAGYKLVEAGFAEVFNVLDGFEGSKVKDKNNPNYGHRRKINGWQYDGFAYTYELEKEFIYKLHTSCGCD